MQQPRDFSLYGAVDLSARQAAAQRRQQVARSAGAPGGASGSSPGASSTAGNVIDVTEQTFNQDVVMRSQTVPVIVDLWADGYNQFSPVLEKLAGEADGAWVLARIDAVANRRIAQMFRAPSIPMVVAIIGGQGLDAFVDALTEAEIRQWLVQVLAAAEQLGLPPAGAAGAAAGPAGDSGEDEEYDDLPAYLRPAREAMESGEFDSAAAQLEKVLAETPSDPLAKSWLAQVNVMRRVSGYHDAAALARAAAQRPDDPDAQIPVADLEVASGHTEEAFDRLLGVIQRTTGDVRNKARLHLLDLFEIFPPGDPTVKAARQRLASLLF
jgi:putative thioredoxin